MTRDELSLKGAKDLRLFYIEIAKTYKYPKIFYKQLKAFNFKGVSINKPNEDYIKKLRKIAKKRGVNEYENGVNIYDTNQIMYQLENFEFTIDTYLLLRVHVQIYSNKTKETVFKWITRVFKDASKEQILNVFQNELLSEYEIWESESDLIIKILEIVIDNYSQNEANQNRKENIIQDKRKKSIDRKKKKRKK